VFFAFFYFHEWKIPMFMLFCKRLGVEVVDEWLKTDMIGCLQNFFVDCMKGDFLNNPEVLSPP